MKVYLATDHAGYETKEAIRVFLEDSGYDVTDCGASRFDPEDDFTDFVPLAVQAVSDNPEARAIVLGGSGQGEAMLANRYDSIRAVVFYGGLTRRQKDAKGNELSIVASARQHNDANVLSLGARFISIDEAIEAITVFLEADFSGEERHIRRIQALHI